MHKECAKEALFILNNHFGYRKFDKVITGTIRGCINSHECIDKTNMLSMTKRIKKQLWANFKQALYDSIEDIKNAGENNDNRE